MSDVAVGVDVVAISRVRRLLDEFPEAFRAHAFSAAERDYCDARSDPGQHYAGRWAVKEAYVKAVWTAGNGRPDLASITVERDRVPALTLSGDGRAMLEAAARERETDADAAAVAVSLTHENALDAALALVVVRF